MEPCEIVKTNFDHPYGKGYLVLYGTAVEMQCECLYGSKRSVGEDFANGIVTACEPSGRKYQPWLIRYTVGGPRASVHFKSLAAAKKFAAEKDR